MSKHTPIPTEMQPLAVLGEAGPQKMSSQEIADLTGKTLKNVIRDVKRMAKLLYGDGSDLIHLTAPSVPGVTVERDGRGYVTQVHLDRDHTMTVITGYNVALRHRIMRRWAELERAAAVPVPAAIPSTYAEALRLAADASEEAERQRALADDRQRVIEAQAPAVAVVERIRASDATLSVTEAAKMLKVQTKPLFTFMQERGWIFRKGGHGRWQGSAKVLAQGLLVHDGFPVMTAAGPVEAYTVRVTPKGIARLAALLVGVQLDLGLAAEGGSDAA
ncbi:phage antirepressor KilAC domain-containing protein [Methylobacterium brachiatum]|uniref:phage antirepressor KilAC domain-containing protein n=1 Tax=Methylobacterium brachiatum TaxID=269660 RepID=UPI000EFAFDAB|nr:phage antirepressor KilAC domain-containing protein [Methylobacterium brachiatum]AYO84046.1 DNA-binding protein [Methylobacterium brachiatum]